MGVATKETESEGGKEPLVSAVGVHRDPESEKRVVNRLKRARGQLNALIEGIEDGQGCREVVIQLAAVSKAIDRAGYAIVSNAMRECVIPKDGNEPELTPDELERLFLMLT